MPELLCHVKINLKVIFQQISYKKKKKIQHKTDFTTQFFVSMLFFFNGGATRVLSVKGNLTLKYIDKQKKNNI